MLENFDPNAIQDLDSARQTIVQLLNLIEDLSADLRAATPIGGDEFTEILRRIAARKVVVIFDCCYACWRAGHAGGIGQPKAVTAPMLAPQPTKTP